MIDALLLMLNKLQINVTFREQVKKSILEKGFDPEASEFVLVTGHRRENFGQGIVNICSALKKFPLIDQT